MSQNKNVKNEIIQDKGRIDCLDGIRGLAACAIAFFWHYQHFLTEHYPFEKVFFLTYNNGYLAVEIFLMISGFCMMIGYSDRIASHEISFLTFLIKRVKRFYPVLIFGTVLTAVLQLSFYLQYNTTFVYLNNDLQHLIYNILLMHSGVFGGEGSFDSPSWCISICIVYYIILFAVLYKTKNKRHAYYFFSAMAILSIALLLCGLEYPILNSLMFRCGAGFSIGVVLHGIYESREKYDSKKVGVCLLVFLIISFLIFRFKEELGGDLQICFILFLGPAIILSVGFVPALNKIFSLKPMVVLGKLSLNVILFHFPIQCIITLIMLNYKLDIDFSSPVTWVIYIISVIAFSAFYEYIMKKKYENWIFNLFKPKEKKEEETVEEE